MDNLVRFLEVRCGVLEAGRDRRGREVGLAVWPGTAFGHLLDLYLELRDGFWNSVCGGDDYSYRVVLSWVGSWDAAYMGHRCRMFKGTITI
jgi:hypothetical protein